jgi:ATP-dependent DNA helicase RecQ
MELTAAGVSVMKGEVPPPATLADIAPAYRSGERASYERRESRRSSPAVDEGFQADPEASARFAKLREVRLNLAREKGLPPYVICHDSVLKEIAMSTPANLQDLGKIKGMGPFKLQSYGQALLDAVKE